MQSALKFLSKTLKLADDPDKMFYAKSAENFSKNNYVRVISQFVPSLQKYFLFRNYYAIVYNRNMKHTILCIPVVSTRSYQTGLYNLSSDGNIQCLKKFLRYTKDRWDEVDVILPSNVDEEHGYTAVESFVNEIIKGPAFTNALEQRLDTNHALRKAIFDAFKSKHYDYILYAGQEVGKGLEALKHVYGFKTIYFDNTLAMTDGTSSMTMPSEVFSRLSRWAKDDLILAKLADETVFATTEQCEYHKRTYALDTIFYPDDIDEAYKQMMNEDSEEIYRLYDAVMMACVDRPLACVFPYRLSDPCYKVRDVVDILDRNLKNELTFFITDPNNCAIISDDGHTLKLNLINESNEVELHSDKITFHKVSPDKKSYYVLLNTAGHNKKFFTINADDLSNNIHINVDEMKAFGVRGVYGRGKDHLFPEGSERVENYSDVVSNIDALETAIKKFLRRIDS